LKQAVQAVMWDKLGPVREETEIEAAIRVLETIQAAALERMAVGSPGRTYNRERMEAIEVPFMITAALLVARSALVRQESRGSHYRSDFPLRDDSRWMKNLVVKKSRTGGTEIDVREVA